MAKLYDSSTDHYVSTDSAVHLLVVCIILALEGMETDMMMIDMETEMMIGMAMGEKENGVLEMKIGMAVMETGMVEIMRSDMAEMGTGMMTTEEEVRALMIISMGQEVEVLIEREILRMRMMGTILPGLLSLYFFIFNEFLLLNFLGEHIASLFVSFLGLTIIMQGG